MATFLAAYRRLDAQTARVERVLAGGRAFLGTAALAAIYLDPTEPTRFVALMYALLIIYAFYGLVIFVLVRRAPHITPRWAYALHGIDIAWASLLTSFSEGALSPFFLFFQFAVLAAAYRWGLRATLKTASVTIAIFLAEATLTATGWGRGWAPSSATNLNWIVSRVSYLSLTGLLVGYLAEQEQEIRAEMAAIADALRPSADVGVHASVANIARLLRRMFDARAVDVIIDDIEEAKTVLWRVDRSAADDSPAPQECAADVRDAWLFATPVRTWFYRRSARKGATAVTAASEGWAIRDAAIELPPLLTERRAFETLIAVDFGLPSEWRGRALVFDPASGGLLATRLNFLATLADHMTPVLASAFLSRRLRSRAGVEERARVARELHDGTIQTLIGAEMSTVALRRRVERELPALAPDVARIETLLHDEVLALRQLMQELQPVDLDSPEQLGQLLGLMIERFRRDTGINARFISDANTAGLPMRAAIEIVRIVQEGLVNVRKHSAARTALVRLRQDRSQWTVTIEDDGRGFEFSGEVSGADLNARVLGPSVIAQRARALGGEVTIASSPEAGARVEVTFNVR